LVRFAPDILDLIVKVLATDNEIRPTLKAGVGHLFTEHWQVHRWEDLMVFSSADVATALASANGVPTELNAPVIVKKLGYIIDYAQFGTLTPDSTMNDIVARVNAAKRRLYTTPTNSPTRRAVQVFDKKAVPTLEKFSGLDEDYFAWKEATVNVLGTAGFGRLLTDPDVSTRHPEVAESVFYALRGAVHGGQAQSIAQGMLDDTRLDPTTLWLALESYYDTALNRANVVLFDIRRLINIRLDPDNTATKFISEYRECLQRLRKNNARIADDNDTLRALLLVAIQDDDFEVVRDSIVSKPDHTIDSILTELRECETLLMMKDHAASHIGGDGVSSTRYSRRTTQSSAVTGSKKQSGGLNYTTFRKWVIPKYPDTWKHAFGVPLFKLLLDWRTEAHKGKTQMQLSENFMTVVESVSQGTVSSGKKKAKSKSRRTSKTGSDQSTPSSGTGGNIAFDGSPGSDGQSEEPPRKRIRLQKSRRVVTERSA
jgi:hypothetical protein